MRIRTLAIFLLCVASIVFPLALEAQTREEVGLWQTAEKSNNPDDLQAYLDRYPEGQFAPMARRRLATLAEAKRAAEVSEWEGREYFEIRRFSGNAKFAEPDNPKAKFWNTAFKLDPRGTCTMRGQHETLGRVITPNASNSTVRCTWERTGNSVTITIPSGLKEACPSTYELQVDPSNKRMTGTRTLHPTGFRCGDGGTNVDIAFVRTSAPPPPPQWVQPKSFSRPPQ